MFASGRTDRWSTGTSNPSPAVTPSAVGRTTVSKGAPQLKRFVVGSPIPSHLAHHERLFASPASRCSSDPLSSVAHATEEILRVLVLVGAGALTLATPIAL
jgi:hypothetical protein